MTNGSEDVDKQEWNVDVYSVINGSLMLHKHVVGCSAHINTLLWPKGTYVVRAVIDEDIVLTDKIIVTD